MKRYEVYKNLDYPPHDCGTELNKLVKEGYFIENVSYYSEDSYVIVYSYEDKEED